MKRDFADLFRKNNEVSIFVGGSRLKVLFLKNMWLPSVFFLDSRSPLQRSFCIWPNPEQRRGSLIVSKFIPRSSCLGSSPGRGHCVVFLGKTLNSHRCLSPPRSINGYLSSELLGKPNKLRESDLRWTSIPSRESRNTPRRFMLQKLG